MKQQSNIFLKAHVVSILLFVFAINISFAQNTLIHFWYFNSDIPNNTPLEKLDSYYNVINEESFIEYHSALEGYPFNSNHELWRKASMERRNNPTQINYRPIANNGLPYDSDEMRGIQIKQPFTGNAGENTMILHLPTTGYENIVLMLAAVDEGAADLLAFDYSADHETTVWTNAGLETSTFELLDEYRLFTLDFSESVNNIDAANNNPHFKIRIRFIGEDMAADNGSRVTFNNISLHGIPLEDTNRPPFIVSPLHLKKLIENGSNLIINLDDVFTDPDDDELTYTAESNRPEFVSVSVNGSNLTLTPNKRADAHITISATDGVNPTIYHTFRALVYPKAHDISAKNFEFTAWDNNKPDYSYPENMIFLQADFADPSINDDLLYPYFIPHNDYNEDDLNTTGFPYNNTRRTRINGLGTDGISFINTGRNRDLGGTLVALNTTGENDLAINFTAGTLLHNERIYAIRLQYRIGISGEFSDFIHNGQIVEYLTSYDGDTKNFRNIVVPEELLNKEYVQLLWRYYHITGDSGPRAQLRLDDIIIGEGLTSNKDKSLELSHWNIYSADKHIFINISKAISTTVTVYDLSGKTITTKNLNGKGLHSIEGNFRTGIYIINLKNEALNETKKIIVN